MYGLGTLRIQPLGYSILTGEANYHPEDTWHEGLPANCIGPGNPSTPSDLPPDGETCFMLQFPFVGKKRYGCASRAAQGGYGDPYVKCEPLFLKSEGFDFVSPLLRVGATVAVGLFLFHMVRGK